MFKTAAIEHVPAVGLRRGCQPAVGGKQFFWMSAAVLIPELCKLDLLHGFMLLHPSSPNSIDCNAPDETWVTVQGCLTLHRVFSFRCSSRSLSYLKPFWEDTCNCLQDLFSFSPTVCSSHTQRHGNAPWQAEPCQCWLWWIEPGRTKSALATGENYQSLHVMKIST